MLRSCAWTFDDNLNRVTGVNFNSTYDAEDATYTYDATDQVTGVDRSASDEAYV